MTCFKVDSASFSASAKGMSPLYCSNKVVSAPSDPDPIAWALHLRYLPDGSVLNLQVYHPHQFCKAHPLLAWHKSRMLLQLDSRSALDWTEIPGEKALGPFSRQAAVGWKQNWPEACTKSLTLQAGAVQGFPPPPPPPPAGGQGAGVLPIYHAAGEGEKGRQAMCVGVGGGGGVGHSCCKGLLAS